MAANYDISLTPSDTNTAKSTTSFIEKQDENEADRRANASKATQEDTLLAGKSDEAGTQNQKSLDETLPEATVPSVAAKPVTQPKRTNYRLRHRQHLLLNHRLSQQRPKKDITDRCDR